MWFGRCADGIYSSIKVATYCVLESNRHGEARGHLAMRLTFTSSRSDSGPADQIGNILRSDRIQELGRSRDLAGYYFMEELTGKGETSRDVIRSVEVRVHDQPLPANCGPWLFEVDSHDQVEAVFQLISQGAKAFSIFEASSSIMNRARACDNQKALILAAENLSNDLPALRDKGCLLLVTGDLRQDQSR